MLSIFSQFRNLVFKLIEFKLFLFQLVLFKIVAFKIVVFNLLPIFTPVLFKHDLFFLFKSQLILLLELISFECFVIKVVSYFCYFYHLLMWLPSKSIPDQISWKEIIKSTSWRHLDEKSTLINGIKLFCLETEFFANVLIREQCYKNVKIQKKTICYTLSSDNHFL